MRWTRRWRKRLRAAVRREAVERELEEELAFHLEMETQKNLRAGMEPEEARRQATLAFGGVERHKEEVRDARALGWLTGLSLDVRLGARMLAKYPGLAVVGGLGMAVAIALGAIFDVAAGIVHARLPLEEGERVVAIELWDTEAGNQERRVVRDFAAWRGELTTVRDLAAYRGVRRNLIVPGATPEVFVVGEMTASGFRAARVPPLLGRYLVDEDEREGAARVVVIGHDVWRELFAGDPDAVGREIRVGSELHTVVGVMPPGFAFPMAQEVWTPLREGGAEYETREGPAIRVFGRLAPGATMESARAELTAASLRAAADSPATHGRLRAEVIPYTYQLFDDMQGMEIPVGRFVLTLLLGVICANVAALVYARTATRIGEITVRTALGASRRRIVTQLFAEALVLSGVAAVVGLGLAGLALRRLQEIVERVGPLMGGLPFWIDLRLSPRTVLYVAGLALLAAAIVGVAPALQATGRRVEAGLRQLGGGTGMQLGRTWTVLIVAQVAFAVAALPPAVYYAWEYGQYMLVEADFPAGEYLSTLVVMEGDTPPGSEAGGPALEARYGDRVTELVRRVREEPGVVAATFSSEVPGHGPTLVVEAEGMPAPAGSGAGYPVRVSRVDLDFFRAFAVPTLAGRALRAGDLGDAASTVVVNRSFVREVLGGQNAVGRRLRYVEGYRAGGVMRTPERGEQGRWYEIVGVVEDFPPRATEPGTTTARAYHALAPGQLLGVSLSVRVAGAPPESFAPRLVGIAAAVDPTLQLAEVGPLSDAFQVTGAIPLVVLTLALLTLSVLLLSAAGIYAMMSFIVAQRRREIGIRSALGARPHRVLATIFSRAARQLATGALVGLALAFLLYGSPTGSLMGKKGPAVLAAVVALMLTVGLLAALGPARRGLRVQPSEALKGDG